MASYVAPPNVTRDPWQTGLISVLSNEIGPNVALHMRASYQIGESPVIYLKMASWAVFVSMQVPQMKANWVSMFRRWSIPRMSSLQPHASCASYVGKYGHGLVCKCRID